MTARRQQNRTGVPAPALFSFITLRKEAFGLTAEAAARKWDETLAKLNGASAVQFIEKTPSRTSPPPKPVPAIGVPPLTAPKTVIWDVTYACNLTCPHCLTDSGRKGRRELDTKDAFRLIDVLAAAKVLYLSLTGGEPFMRSDLLELLAHLADTGMRVDVATNGFHVSPKIIKGLRRLPVFQIQVSIDGIVVLVPARSSSHVRSARREDDLFGGIRRTQRRCGWDRVSLSFPARLPAG